MTKYQGPIVRDAREGDPNYDKYKDQVVINMRTGGEMVVERSEVSGAKAPATSAKPVAPGPPVEVNHDYDDGSKSHIKGTGPQSGPDAREDGRRRERDRQAAASGGYNPNRYPEGQTGAPNPNPNPDYPQGGPGPDSSEQAAREQARQASVNQSASDRAAAENADADKAAAVRRQRASGTTQNPTGMGGKK